MAAKKKNAVTKPEEGGALTTFDYGDDAGVGYEHTSGADYAIPFLAILQSNSPQVDGSVDGAKIKGALPGMLIDTVSMELYEAEEEGVVIVPCDTQHVFTEWIPRDKGGGFVGIHTTDSDVVKKAREAAEKFGKYSHPESGNDIVETFYMYGMHLADKDDPEPKGMFVIGFTSTKIKKYKQIMYRLRTFKGKPPLFAHRLRVMTVGEKNQYGAFKNFKIEPVNGDIPSSLVPPKLDDQPHPILLHGRQLMEQVRSGLARAAFESQTAAGTGDGGSGDDVF